MSLRQQIAGGATLAVAAVAIALGLANYLTAQSHLLSELRGELRSRAASVVREPVGPPGTPSSPPAKNATSSRSAPRAPSAPALGGAPGYFQFVTAGGRVTLGQTGTARLPVDRRVRAVARGTHRSFFTTARVRGTRVEILVQADRRAGYAIEVALPLTGVDSVSRQLLISDVVLVGIGILLAGALGGMIARAALAPILAFVNRTEHVELAEPDRLAERGPRELRRLAASFNRTLAALQRSIVSQRNLVADASHELRTPLGALRSNVQVLLMADQLPQSERDGLGEAILDDLDDLTQLVADVVELARDTQAPQPAVEVELDRVVQAAIDRASRRSPGLRFAVDLEPAVIVNSPDRVTRAVTNVIDNACKWSPAGGLIDVVLHERQLFVRDRGAGFDPEDLPHVFDRFYRAATARRTPGSGLGLAIVKQAAETFGGSVHADNAPDGGAIIRLSFGSAATPGASSSGSGPGAV